MANNVKFTIGSYRFDPAPSEVNISSELLRTGSGKVFNTRFSANLTGSLVASSEKGVGCSGIGVGRLIELQKDMRQCLTSCSGCLPLQFCCDSGVLLDVQNARVNSINFLPSSNNWVYTTDYSIDVEWFYDEDNFLNGQGVDASGNPLISGTDCSGNGGCFSCLGSISETWEVSSPSRSWTLCGNSGSSGEQFQISHNLSAQGFDCCVSGSGITTPGWEIARDWVMDRAGPGVSGANIPCLTVGTDVSGFTYCDIQRTKTVDKCEGIFTLNETMTAVDPSGSACVETFSMDCTESIQNSLTNFSINGTITGLEKRDSNFNVTTTKLDSAKACWADISGQLINRLNCCFTPTCPINTNPVSKTVGYNPAEGTITYAYQFYDKPALFSNPLIEDINISDTLPAEVVTEIQVPGRQAGPILHRCRTTTAQTRNASITAVLPKRCITNCSGVYTLEESGVIDALCCIEQDLFNQYNIVIKTADNRDWNPFTGSYSRQVTWTVQDCSGTLPGNFCP